MRRRHFIGLLGSAPLAWPAVLCAQPSAPARRICVMMALPASDPGAQSEVTALKQGLRELGWSEERNLRIEYLWSGGEPSQIESAAKQLVDLKCDVIVARSTPVVAALLKQTHTIPIVFAVLVDPVGNGFVESFARPGGNVTGFQNYEFTMVDKWLQLLKEMSPAVQRVASIYNPETVPAGFVRSLEKGDQSVSVQAVAVPVRGPAEIEAALTEFARQPAGGLFVMPDNFNLVNREQIITLAAKLKLPAVYVSRSWSANGGLISYGPDTPDLFRRAAGYVDRILKGEKPADLPVQASTKYELVINLKTAKVLDLIVPPTLLARADEVIE